MAIICRSGGTEHTHTTVAEVKVCYGVAKTVELPDPADMGNNQNRGWVSRERDRLRAQESHGDGRTHKRPAVNPQTLAEGFYVHENHPYKVIVAHNGSGRKYAKILNLETGKWDYGRGAIYKLSPDEQMTLEQALDIAKVSKDVNSILYGRCFICGTPLTDDNSIERGIGPICAGKYF